MGGQYSTENSSSDDTSEGFVNLCLSDDLSSDSSDPEEDTLTWYPLEGRQSFYTAIGEKYFIISIPPGTDGEYFVFDGVVDITSRPSELYTSAKHILAKISEEDATVMRSHGWEEIRPGILNGVHILDMPHCRLCKKVSEVRLF